MAVDEAMTIKVGFIGAGRLGQALAWRLAACGFDVHAVASRSEASAHVLAEGAPGCRVDTAQAVADTCDLVFVTTPDAAIEATACALRWRPGMGVVHCSGATELVALKAAAAQGAQIGGFHPMQTFTDPHAAARTLSGCVITIEASDPLSATLHDLAARMGCSGHTLPTGMRGRYHAAGGYASQFINVLLAEAVKIWGSWGADEADALRALLPLLKGTVSAIEASGIAHGMPGPVSRGDTATVARHVQALQSLDGDVVALYSALCRRSVPLARQAGRLSPEGAQAILALLPECGGPSRA
ncbi:Rossmann-like and DUF2520 domain-containing protein [Paracandidimonas lactea]|uniref:Rossmann-like and DUF2520 domain-containing protein n=1 Tax=Paracandidimonas lactea TaxID=2895524 RepID=UPI001F35A505|nr:DUF2520 domain-containing protein [Paracandidimonas lactea]